MENLVFPLSEKEAKDKGIKRNSNDNKNAKFPSRLRELRATHKSPDGKTISQQMLADIEDIAITKSTISLYETGENIPDAKRIVMLANYFGVSTDYLLCQTDVKTPNIDIREITKQTGLSEESINNIKSIFNGKNDKYDLRIFNEFLSNKDLLRLLHAISLYIVLVQSAKSNEKVTITINQNGGDIPQEEIDDFNKKYRDTGNTIDLQLFIIQKVIVEIIVSMSDETEAWNHAERNEED